MDTEKSREKLEQVKDRYSLGGDLEKVKEQIAMTPTPRRN
jgi:hypothetical protein